MTWLAAQEHSGENIGETDTHVLFVELKEDSTRTRTSAARRASRVVTACPRSSWL